MPSVAARKYQQRLRAESAEETRRRVLDAVLERFAAAPTERVSVDQVARMAGVARSTVYLIFGSRAGLFDAVARDLLDRGGFDRVVRATEDPDAREHLRGGFRGTAHTFAAHRDAFRVLYSMASLDPDAVGGAIQRAEERRAGGMRYLAGQLEEQGLLRDRVSPEAAAHLMWVLTSFDGFDLLYAGRGMSADEVAQTFIDTAERALLR
jgi:AcrR family transcriptional regulator